MAAAANTSSGGGGGEDSGGGGSSEVRKRYDGLVMVKMKAIKGKGAWYWAHLEPVLVPDSDSGLPKAVKLRCSLCDAVFSASNPSRTASEHLKRGTCPNFNSSAAPPLQQQSPAAAEAQTPPSHNHRKRSVSGRGRSSSSSTTPWFNEGVPNTNLAPVSLQGANRRGKSTSTTIIEGVPKMNLDPVSTLQGHSGGKSTSSAFIERVPKVNLDPVSTLQAHSGGKYISTTIIEGVPKANLDLQDHRGGKFGSITLNEANLDPVSTLRAHRGGKSDSTTTTYEVSPLAIVDASRFSVDLASMATSSANQQQQQLMLSGGKEDLGALAMLEDSVKKLKSPKTSPGPTLSKLQVDSALDALADWVYECCGSVSFSSLEHPKFRAFLSQVGLPSVSRKELAGPRLDAKYEEAKAESEVKIRDAMFFQIAADGWKAKNVGEENLVNLSVNLPNGTSVYRRAVITTSFADSKYAEDVLWDTISDICGQSVHQCVGIVGDKFKAKALRNLENQHQWMVNISCQYQAFNSLIKDFGKELPLFKNTTENCISLANFINNKSQIRNAFHKYQLQEYGHAGLLRVPLLGYERFDFGPVYALVEDILSSARALQLVILDDSYKAVSMDEQYARGIEEMLRSPQFWNELEAVHSVVKLVKTMAQDIETEKPRVGQCLPLWEELRVKIKEWCSKFNVVEGPVEKIIEKRFNKNYHPAWAAAFILDPLYLIKDASGRYLPPFKYLTPEQEKDVDKLITRLVSLEEAHIALMELMKWRTEGLDPVYAQAVQLKQRDPNTGKMKIANPQSSRLVWETYLTEFKALGKVAVRLIFLHATSCGFKCNSSFMRWVGALSHSRVGLDRAQKLVFIAAHSKLEKRDFSSEEDKDGELFAIPNGEDDILNEVFVDTTSL